MMDTDDQPSQENPDQVTLDHEQEQAVTSLMESGRDESSIKWPFTVDKAAGSDLDDTKRDKTQVGEIQN
ncbi:hypothetical protein NC652_022425 [Populus alba x Populus x berolinensis]|nr:hypothetical protein NC652_022425 [Populus alba x Populus x berolinensis]